MTYKTISRDLANAQMFADWDSDDGARRADAAINDHLMSRGYQPQHRLKPVAPPTAEDRAIVAKLYSTGKFGKFNRAFLNL